MPWPTSPTDHRSDESGRGGSRDAASGATLAPGLSSVTLIGILTVVYFAAARFGLSLAAMHKSVSLVWPPTGIALAAVLLFGYRIWPGIALGAFLANAFTGVGLAVSAAIATGNTLEALAGAYLLRHLTQFRESLERPQDVLGFTALAAGAVYGGQRHHRRPQPLSGREPRGISSPRSGGSGGSATPWVP